MLLHYYAIYYYCAPIYKAKTPNMIIAAFLSNLELDLIKKYFSQLYFFKKNQNLAGCRIKCSKNPRKHFSSLVAKEIKGLYEDAGISRPHSDHRVMWRLK